MGGMKSLIHTMEELKVTPTPAAPAAPVAKGKSKGRDEQERNRGDDWRDGRGHVAMNPTMMSKKIMTFIYDLNKVDKTKLQQFILDHPHMDELFANLSELMEIVNGPASSSSSPDDKPKKVKKAKIWKLDDETAKLLSLYETIRESVNDTAMQRLMDTKDTQLDQAAVEAALAKNEKLNELLNILSVRLQDSIGSYNIFLYYYIETFNRILAKFIGSSVGEEKKHKMEQFKTEYMRLRHPLTLGQIKKMTPVMRLIHEYPRLVFTTVPLTDLVGKVREIQKLILSDEDSIIFWESFGIGKDGRPVIEKIQSGFILNGSVGLYGDGLLQSIHEMSKFDRKNNEEKNEKNNETGKKETKREKERKVSDEEESDEEESDEEKGKEDKDEEGNHEEEKDEEEKDDDKESDDDD